ncbi:MAG TPA: MotA/TolQ/ExbB proton channel family protein [Cyclobacteriaceae bacterium]|nr:MotA/TolQ/ExbB proton channel family protein [Cyclobacteriaceae bacterium]
MIILQIVTGAEAVNSSDSALSVFELAMKGGFMMVPILVLWVVGIYIFFERLFALKKAAESPDHFMARVKEQVMKGDVNGARMLCSQNPTPVARMIEKGIARIGSPLKNIETSIENVGKIEIFKLEKNLPLMATIAGAAPMLGFLGTVIGMVKAFISISQEEGAISPKLLSEGIYTAMITTVAGLIVGVISYLAYNYLVTRVQKIIHAMEYTSIDFIDLLQEPK